MACKYKYNNQWHSKEELQSILYKERGIDKYGKLVKPEINTSQRKILSHTASTLEGKYVAYLKGGEEQTFNTKNELDNFIKSLKEIGIQPTQTRENTTSIESVKNKTLGIFDNSKYVHPELGSMDGYNNFESEEFKLDTDTFKLLYNVDKKTYNVVKKFPNYWQAVTKSNLEYYSNIKGIQVSKIIEEQKKLLNEKIEKFNKKEYTEQALINTKIAKLKEVAKKYPRSLIRSEVKGINTSSSSELYDQFGADELPFQKIPSLSPEETSIQQEIDNISKDIQKKIEEDNNKKTNLSSLVDDYYKVMSTHLKNLISKQNYKVLNKLFTGEHGVLKITSTTDTLKKARELQESIENSRKQANAIAKSINQIDYLSTLMEEDILNILKDSENEPVTILKTLGSYLNTIQDWKILLKESQILGNPGSVLRNTVDKSLGRIESIEKNISENNESAIVQTLKEILIPKTPEEDYRSGLDDKITQLKRRQQANPSKTKDIQKDIDIIESLKEKYDFTNGENIIGFLRGESGYGDAGYFNSFVEKFSNSSDPIIAGFRKYIHDIINKTSTKAIQWEQKFYNELAPLIKSSERLDPKSLTEKISFEDTVLDTKTMEPKKVVTLLNPWKDYRYEEQSLKIKEQEAKNKWLSSKKDEDKESYNNAKKARQTFEKEVLFQQYNSKYYGKFKLFEDAIGQSLKEDIDDIFDQINDIQEKYYSREEELTPEDLEQIDSLLREYKLLGNVNNVDGTPKEGLELDKALKMREIRAINREIYEFKPNYVLFEKAKENYIDFLHTTLNLDKDSPEFKQALEEWIERNTKTIITPQYYKDVEILFLELQYLLEKTKNPEIEENIQKQYKIVNDLLYGNRDEDNQPIGTLFQDKASERIKAAQEIIEELKQKAKFLGHLTIEQGQRLEELETFELEDYLTREEQIEIQNLRFLQQVPNLTKTESERLEVLLEELSEIQSKLPTEYYVDTFNNISAKYGINITDKGTIEEDGTEVNILDSKTLNTLLEKEDFKEWFNKNHYIARKWNKDIKEYENVWTRTPQWSVVKPNNEKYYEQVPSNKYTRREVKPEYQTGYNPDTKKVELEVGKHIDNKGNFLPDPSKQGSEKYRNEKYYELVNSKSTDNQRLVKILNIFKSHLLEGQENLNYSNKLYLDIPGVLKSTREKIINFFQKVLKNPSSFPKEIINLIKSKWKEITSFDYADINYEPKESKENKFQKDFTSIPIRFTEASTSDIGSYDFFSSISKYYYSSELHKSLKESLPIAKTIVQETEKQISLQNKKSNRARAIRRIFEADYEGKTSAIEFGDNQGVRKVAQTIGSFLTSSTVVMSIKYNPNSTLANTLEAKTSNIIKSFGSKLFTPQNLALAEKDLHSIYIWNWILDYFRNDPTKYTLQTQLHNIFSPTVGESTIENLGNKFSESTLENILTLQPLRNNRNISEVYAQSTLWLAILKSVKITQNTPEGIKNITLEDAYELGPDNIIKLKEGIDLTWNFNGQSFLDIKTKISRLLQETHGASSQDDKSFLDASFIWGMFAFLKKFLVDKTVDAFAFKNIGTLSNPIIIPIYNLHKGSRIGYTSQTIATLINILQERKLNINNLTTTEKQALGQQFAKLAIILGAITAYSLYGYGGDDKEKKKKLAKLSWFESNFIYLSRRLALEQSSIYNPYTFKDYISNFMFLNSFNQWVKTLLQFVTGEEYKNQQKTPSGRYVYKKGDKKWKNSFKKAIGMKGPVNFVTDPDQTLKDYESILNARR